MEIYRGKTQQIIDQFLDNQISFEECTGALDQALANLAHRGIGQEHETALRILTSANSEMVMKEMERRNTPQSQRVAPSKARQRRSLPSDVSDTSEAAS